MIKFGLFFLFSLHKLFYKFINFYLDKFKFLCLLRPSYPFSYIDLLWFQYKPASCSIQAHKGDKIKVHYRVSNTLNKCTLIMQN